jgi:hypothetical protein
MDVRKPKFLYLEENVRRDIVAKFKARIQQGFYNSETVLSEIVDRLAPDFDEEANKVA